MLTTAQRLTPERASRRKSQKYVNNRHFNFSIKFSHPSNLESRMKSWAVDRMMESLYEGRESSQHKLATAFWKKSGRRLRDV